MSVDKICNHNVATVSADANIADVAAGMREAHVGDVIVTEYRRGREAPIGVITDRDIVVEVIAPKIDPTSVAAKDIMSTGIVTVKRDNGVEFALAEMRRSGVRRIAVVDQDDALVGVLSVDDVIEHLAAMLDDIAGMLRAEQRKEAALRP
ncbi:MAG: CBS domain-containing protein [Gammaproteobacteria bacterium]|nr:CBS domain-containing protein [Gammaproteobacteria bacterium]